VIVLVAAWAKPDCETRKNSEVAITIALLALDF
jgi:hypothetical protein